MRTPCPKCGAHGVLDTRGGGEARAARSHLLGLHDVRTTLGRASCISYGVAPNRPTHDLKGRGPLYRGDELLDVVDYTVQTDFDQGTVVVFDSKPPANDGDVVSLTLEDGRFIVCQILDESPYCSVIGEGPRAERRRRREVSSVKSAGLPWRSGR